LKESQVELVVGKLEQRSTEHNDKLNCPLVIATVEPIAQDVLKEITCGRKDTERVSETSLAAAVERIADKLKQAESQAIILTRQTHAALCLANRHKCVRAVFVEQSKDVHSVFRAIGANVLVVDPQSRNRQEVKNIVQEFQSGGPWPIPPQLRAALNG
jgi:ribose 5-phosphate isomerase RpiB